MHNLSASFILGYHGCEREIDARLLLNAPFLPSENDYDWLGSGIYFWEANPDRALQWARERTFKISKTEGRVSEPFVLGAVIDPGFCLDLITANGIHAVERAYDDLQAVIATSGKPMPENTGGSDYLLRELDATVINLLHRTRERSGEAAFDTVRGVFTEGEHIYPNSGFRRRTHIQICVRNPANIHGVFRVAERYFSS